MMTSSRGELIRPLPEEDAFVLLVFDASETNLVMARLELDLFVVDRSGVRGREPVHAPPFFAAWLNRIVAAQELTVEAALTGDRDLVHAAMLLDPHAGTLGLATIEQMTAELLDATARWLPQF